MPPRRLNIAIIGLGRMGKIYAHTIAAHVPEARLYAVAEPNLRAASAFLSDVDVPHVVESTEEVLALPDVDAVVVATPTSMHRHIILAAAAAGKAVFSEKPLALTLEDTRAIIDGVREAGVPLQVGFQRRFDKEFQRAKEMIDAGQIGRLITFKAIGRDLLCPRPDFADPAHSGGMIIDMGIHDMDIARWLMGSEVTRVSAEGSLLVCRELEDVGDIDNAVINLRFENGSIGNVELSRNGFYGYDLRTEVLGTKGRIRIGDDRRGMLVDRDARPYEAATYLIKRFGTAYRAQLQHFIQCLWENRPPPATGDDALAAFEIALAATRSVRTGRPVSIESVRAGIPT